MSEAVDMTDADGATDTSIDVGSGGVTFDDFEAMETSREELADAKVESKKETKRWSKKETVQKGEGKEAKEPAKKEAKAESKTEELTEKEIKKLVARFGDDAYDIPSESTIKHKIDGKDTEVTVQELLNNYSGKTSWDKKFSEVDKTQKQVMAEKNEYTQAITGLSEMVKNSLRETDPSDPRVAVSKMLDLLGQDKQTFYNRLKETMIPDWESWSNMSDQERQSYELEQDNKFFKNELESVKLRDQQQATRLDLQKKFEQIRETHGLTEQNLVEAYNWGNERQLQGLDDPQKIAEIAMDRIACDRAVGVIEGYNSELLANREVFDAVADMASEYPDFTDEELTEVIVSAVGTDEDVAKVKKAMAKKGSKPKGVETKVSSDYVSFDDFEDMN
jgi:hypothetical protein